MPIEPKPYKPLRRYADSDRPPINRGVLPPPANKSSRRKYAWSEMQLGDSFVLGFPPQCDRYDRRRLQQKASAMIVEANLAHRPKRWKQLTIEGVGVKIWRVQ
jgi:hypothetical protein